jgi:hypothetical protein
MALADQIRRDKPLNGAPGDVVRRRSARCRRAKSGETGHLIALDRDPADAGHRPQSVANRGRAFGACPAHRATRLTRPNSRALTRTRAPMPATRLPPHPLEAGLPLVMPPRGSGAADLRPAPPSAAILA